METNHVISHQTLINILNDLLPFKYFHILLLSFLYIIFNYNNTLFYEGYNGFFPSTISIGFNSENKKIFYDFYLMYFLSIYIFMVFRYILKGLSINVQNEFLSAYLSGLKSRRKKITPNPNANKIINTGIILSLFVPLFCFFVFGMMDVGQTKFFMSLTNSSDLFFYIFLTQLSIGNIYAILFSVTLMEMKKYVLFN